MAKGSVITTHLLDGDPQGIRSVFIKNKTCQMLVIPRDKLSEALSNNDISLAQPGMYILLESLNYGDGEKPKTYIGHSEEISSRLNQHNNSGGKSFFQIALVFVSTDHSINKADVQYLEFQAINLAKDCARYALTNENNGTLPHLTPDQRDVVEEFWDFIKLLTAFYGCRIFTKPLSIKKGEKLAEKKIFKLKYGGVEASALYGNGEIVLLKGSEIRRKTVDSMAKNKNKREKFMKENCIEKDGKILLKYDLPISSPSEAALLVTGTGLNGWNFWKTKSGKTMDEVFRQTPSE